MAADDAGARPTQADRAGAGLPGEATRATVGRVSVVVPVKNEERTIMRLLEGLLAQTRPPDEIVITDGGSADRTRDIVREFQRATGVPVVLVEAEQALPGRGRNLAIARASSEWVACIDAGIVPRRDWLAELITAAGREPSARVIFGRFEAVTESFFTECAAMVYAPRPGSFRRSIASCLMHRSAWEAAGRFREDLRSSEDLIFFKGLDAADVPRVFTHEAVVAWSLKPSARATFSHFSTYSRSNIRAGLFAEWQLRLSLMYAALAGAFLAGLLWWWPLVLLPPLALLLRAERRIYNWRRGQGRARLLKEMLDPRRVLGVAWVNLVIDAAAFRGMLEWLRRDFRRASTSS